MPTLPFCCKSFSPPPNPSFRTRSLVGTYRAVNNTGLLLLLSTPCIPAARGEKQPEEEGKRKQDGVAVAFLCSSKVVAMLLLLLPSDGHGRRLWRRRKQERMTRVLLRGLPTLSRRIVGIVVVVVLLLLCEVGCGEREQQ